MYDAVSSDRIINPIFLGRRSLSCFQQGPSQTISRKLKSTDGIRDGGPWPHGKPQEADLTYAAITGQLSRAPE